MPSFSIFPIPHNTLPFVLQEKVHQKVIFFWLQLAKSKFEAQNYEYSIQLVHPDVGKFQYQGKKLSLRQENSVFSFSLTLLYL